MTIKFFATLRLSLGVASVEVDNTEPVTVRDALEKAEKQLGAEFISEVLQDNGQPRMGAMILIDGKNIVHLSGVETPVQNETLSVFPPAGGG
jgi:sulfur-carrier protein